MPHMTTPEAEKILDTEIPVLDEGYIRLVDYMGGDKRVTDAARVSYKGETKVLRTDHQLIRYLLRHSHTTPFEKIRFEFHVKLPIFVARQWMRHRMSSYNEMSARYSVLEDEFYFPEKFRSQSNTNKQGSGDAFSHGASLQLKESLEDHCNDSYYLYKNYIDLNVSREISRMVLPVNIYTQFYWTIDLWNLMHFMRLRSDSHAQYEIREYSQAIEKIVKAVCPVAYDAWVDYHRDAIKLSRMEKNVITAFIETYKHSNDMISWFSSVCSDKGMKVKTSSGKFTREFKEFLNKFNIDH